MCLPEVLELKTSNNKHPKQLLLQPGGEAVHEIMFARRVTAS